MHQVAHPILLSHYVLCCSGLLFDLEQDHLAKDPDSLRSLRQTAAVTQPKALTQIPNTLDALPDTIYSLTDGNATLGVYVFVFELLGPHVELISNLLLVILYLVSTVSLRPMSRLTSNSSKAVFESPAAILLAMFQYRIVQSVCISLHCCAIASLTASIFLSTASFALASKTLYSSFVASREAISTWVSSISSIAV
jgi:hypothetical protein